jgi:SAM-dependent methyltransferase
MANVSSQDLVYDLGCGDGRLVVTAAKEYGARGVGIDIDPERIKDSKENAAKAGVTDKVKFILGDLFEADFHEATVVTLYLLPELNVRLRPILMKQLKPGVPVVSHDFDMGEWQPDETKSVKGATRTHTVYRWLMPADVGGVWEWSTGESGAAVHYQMNIHQKFQKLTATMKSSGHAVTVDNAQLAGTEISFTLPDSGERYMGRVNGNGIEGSVSAAGGQESKWSAHRIRRQPTGGRAAVPAPKLRGDHSSELRSPGS